MQHFLYGVSFVYERVKKTVRGGEMEKMMHLCKRRDPEKRI